jgi:glycosyltransferase involved in cell wall biosynthesis
MSLSVWNLARKFAEHGHRVSIVTPAHGRLHYLKDRYGVEELDYHLKYEMPLLLDRKIWTKFPPTVNIPLTTRAHHMSLDGVDIYFLSNDYLDLLSDRFYPSKASEGADLSFFKPLIFQIDGVQFIERVFSAERVIVQAYEPLYHYLLALAFKDSPDRLVVSTVASNMPINQKVYRPQVDELLNLLSVDADLDVFSDEQVDSPLMDVMRLYMPTVHLNYEYSSDYVSVFCMVATSCNLINFLSEGQKDFYSTFKDTPFQALFNTLTVSRVVKDNAYKQFVGGCAVSDEWLQRDPSTVDRVRVLNSLGLNPHLPTFYHSARYSVHHKGQVELMQAIDTVLASDRNVNFVVRCLLRAGSSNSHSIGNEYFQEVAECYPQNVFLDWQMVDEDTLFEQAASADFCIFPSKFELDTFLIAQGEAMACGAVPVATAQQGTRHYGHHRDVRFAEATGFSVNRSFTENDPLLVEDLVTRIREALDMFRNDPAEYAKLSANSRSVARGFTWKWAAERHLEMFDVIDCGDTPRLSDDDALRYGWFELLSEKPWTEDRDRIARAAAEHGDLATYSQCAVVDELAIEGMFKAAYTRGYFETCERLATEVTRDDLVATIQSRCRIEQSDDHWSVMYRFPAARRIDLFLPLAASPSDSHRLYERHMLAKQDDAFRATFPGSAPSGHLSFLLTLASGGFAWDKDTMS